MNRNKHFFGQPIFSQLLNLINSHQVEKLALEYKSDRYCKKFSTFQHLITMSYGVVSGCNSLRELCSGIVSFLIHPKEAQFQMQTPIVPIRFLKLFIIIC